MLQVKEFDTTASTNFYNVTCVLVARGRSELLQGCDVYIGTMVCVRKQMGVERKRDVVRALSLQVVVFFWQGDRLGLQRSLVTASTNTNIG